MAATELQINAASRFQVIVERVKAEQSRSISRDIINLGNEIAAILSTNDNLQDLTLSQQNSVISQAESLVSNYIEGKYSNDLEGFVRDLMSQTIDREVDTLNEAIESKDFDAQPVEVDSAYTSYLETPMTDGSATSAILVGSMLSVLAGSESRRVGNKIRGGISSGLTTQEIITSVRGTQSRNYRDGALNTVAINAITQMKTASQHGVNVSRVDVYRENNIRYYEIVATLDSKTSGTCRGLDGNVYELGKGPMPPFHPNCRTMVVGSIDGRRDVNEGDSTRASRGPSGRTSQVDASLTYYEWLKNQPSEFQNLAIGPTRAKLLRDGGISAERFAELSLNRNFEPLTLDEMRQINPQIFTRAGV